MKIALGSDHGGYAYKEEIKKHLLKNNYDVVDVGTYGTDSVDYPLFGKKAADEVANGNCEFGILVCTSGEGICISANKVNGIRCGIGYSDNVSAKLREHNDANMIAFGQSEMKIEDVLRRVDIFLSTSFEGGRHQRRVDEITSFEK